MMSEILHAIGMGEFMVSASQSDVLVAYGLGSCVAICHYDPVAHLAGLLHALLPTNPTDITANGADKSAKFVDEGAELLLEEMMRQGGSRACIKTAICGGAHMLNAPGFNKMPKIGEKNILAAENMLSKLGLRLYSRDTGGSAGRTVKLFVANGCILIKTLGKGEKPLEGGWNA